MHINDCCLFPKEPCISGKPPLQADKGEMCHSTVVRIKGFYKRHRQTEGDYSGLEELAMVQYDAGQPASAGAPGQGRVEAVLSRPGLQQMGGKCLSRLFKGENGKARTEGGRQP